MKIFKSVFKGLGVISLIGLICSVILTYFAYEKVGWAIEERGFAPEVVSRAFYSKGLTFKGFILESVNTLFLLSSILYWIFIIPSLIYGYWYLFKRPIQFQYILIMLCLHLFTFVQFQDTLGLDENLYCFICWYLENE